MELTDQVKNYLCSTAASLRGYDRRLFMARTICLLGSNGQRRAERELGWNRVTIRKGTHELASGIRCLDDFAARGRYRVEEHLPNLLHDIRVVIDGQSQTDPTFRTRRLYTRLTVAELRRQLISGNGYTDEQLPSDETLRRKIHDLGYQLRKVAKSRPKKRCPRPMTSSLN
jgi:hypothetical protein